MKKIVLLLGLLLSVPFACAKESNELLNYVVKDGYNDFTCQFANETLELADLDKIEMKILGKNYKNEKWDSRLSRIESRIFGAIQSGNPKKRINLINEYTNKCLISNAIGGNFGFGGGINRGYRGGFYPQRWNNRMFNNRYWNRFHNGYITGFSPPVNRPFYPNSYGYYQNGVYNSYPNYGGFNLGTRIIRFFNPNYTPKSQNVYQDPNVYGNYTPNSNKKSIQLFDANGQGGMGDMYSNGYGYDTGGNANSGATVTIID